MEDPTQDQCDQDGTFEELVHNTYKDRSMKGERVKGIGGVLERKTELEYKKFGKLESRVEMKYSDW